MVLVHKKFKKINHAVNIDTSPYELEETVYRTAVSSVKKQFPNIRIIESGQIAMEVKTIFIALNGDVFIYKQGKTQNELVGNLTLDVSAHPICHPKDTVSCHLSS